MPPLRLANVLQTALPPLSATSRAVVSALACCNGHASSAGEIPAWGGLRGPHQLPPRLRRDGPPPPPPLAGWAPGLYWGVRAGSGDPPPPQLARPAHAAP